MGAARTSSEPATGRYFTLRSRVPSGSSSFQALPPTTTSTGERALEAVVISVSAFVCRL